MTINKYQGEFKLKIYGIEYPMLWNYNTYCEFESETGMDANTLFTDMVNELNVMQSLGTFNQSEEASASEVMSRLSGIAQAKYAVWLFYLAAKAKDSAVTFEEIQEGVMLEGVTQNKLDPDGELVSTYPHLVLKFAIDVLSIGVDKDDVNAKKSGSLKHSFLGKLRHLFSM